MTPTATSTISDYAAAVRAELSDLSPDQAHAVLDGLDEHLSEIAAEGGDDLVVTLGSPASYAAELRASAGLERGPSSRPRPEAGPTVAPPAALPRVSLLSTHRVTLARAVLAGALGLMAVVTIRATRPLNGIEVIFAATIVAAVWRVLRALGRHAHLPEAVETRLPVLLAATAVVSAVLFGGKLAGDRTVYIGSPSQLTPATTFGGFGRAEARRVVPNLIGASYEDASDMLRALGFEPIITGPVGDSVTALDPKPGSLAPHGSRIMVGMAATPAAPATTFTTVAATTTVAPTTTVGPTTAAPTTTVGPTTAAPTSTAPPAP